MEKTLNKQMMAKVMDLSERLQFLGFPDSERKICALVVDTGMKLDSAQEVWELVEIRSFPLVAGEVGEPVNATLNSNPTTDHVEALRVCVDEAIVRFMNRQTKPKQDRSVISQQYEMIIRQQMKLRQVRLENLALNFAAMFSLCFVAEQLHWSFATIVIVGCFVNLVISLFAHRIALRRPFVFHADEKDGPLKPITEREAKKLVGEK